jgi:hypothetical protein
MLPKLSSLAAFTRLTLSVVWLTGFAGAAAAQTTGFVYALQQVNSGPNQIHGFQLDVLTGALTALPGFPVATGGLGAGLLVSQHMAYRNGRLFVINDGSNTISAFVVNRTTGALTTAPFSPIALAAGSWACLAVHPTGSPLVAGDVGGAGVLASFAITATSATPVSSASTTAPAAPLSCAFSRDGSYVYAGGSGSSIAAFSASPAGVLTAVPGSPVDTGNPQPLGLATDDAGRLFAAVGALAVGSQLAFTTPGGLPSGVTGNPFSSGVPNGHHGVVHPAGFYLTVDRENNLVGVSQIAGTGAATTLTPIAGSPFTSGGTFPNILATTPDGRLVISANTNPILPDLQNSRNLSVYRMNAAIGGFAHLGTLPANALGNLGNITGLALAPVTMNRFDRDADLKADLGVYRPSTGTWWHALSSTNFTAIQANLWGLSTDVPVPGDYDGDRKADVAHFRPSDGLWWILLSGSGYNTYIVHQFGVSTDVPMPGDYDGDLRTDIAVYRPSTGVWWILTSRSNFTAHVAQQFGESSDVPIPGDYDGDAQSDVAVFRPSTSRYYFLKSSSLNTQFTVLVWGFSTDQPVPDDYDADGKTDVTIYRAGQATYWSLFSGRDYTTYRSIAAPVGSVPLVPTDYDGDGKTDVAHFQPETGTWWILWSTWDYSPIYQTIFAFGTQGDIPLPRR